jgi:uncharacterized protein
VRTLEISLLLLLLALAGCDGGSAGGEPTGSGNAPDRRTVTIDASGGEEVEVRVEIADTDPERQRGLMGRTALPEDQGMLFVFGGEQELSFWMKNTLIPLSIAFFDAGGDLVARLDMEPCPADPCPVYDPGESYRVALEVNQGFFAEIGLDPGWRIELPTALRAQAGMEDDR